MIVTITLPPSANGAKYGAAEFQADENNQLELPDYVAKELLALGGVTGTPILAPTEDLLAGVADEFELNYLFIAYRQPIPQEIQTPRVDEETGEPVLDEGGDQIIDIEPSGIADKAAALFAARGNPIASLV